MRSLQIDYFLLIGRLSPLAPAPHPITYLHTSVSTDRRIHVCTLSVALPATPAFGDAIDSVHLELGDYERLELLTFEATLQSPLGK